MEHAKPSDAPPELKSEGWLIDMWAYIFEIAAKLSPMAILRWIFPSLRDSRVFVDAYVLGHTLLAFAAFFIVTLRWDHDVTWLFHVVAFYGLWRILDMFCYQINVLLFDQYRKWRRGLPHAIHGYPRMVVAIAHNYWEMISWFGLFYVYLHRMQSITLPDTPDHLFLHLLRQSMLMMLSYNAEGLKAADSLGVALLSFQSIVGLILTVVIFARFLSLLPPPISRSNTPQAPAAPPQAPSEKDR